MTYTNVKTSNLTIDIRKSSVISSAPMVQGDMITIGIFSKIIRTEKFNELEYNTKQLH